MITQSKRHKEFAFALKRGLRPWEAAERVGSRKLFAEMESAGWIAPVVHRHKLKLFDAADVDRAWLRILAGELPCQTKAAVPAGHSSTKSQVSASTARPCLHK